VLDSVTPADGYASRGRVVVYMMCACVYVNVCSDVLGALSISLSLIGNET